MRFRTVSGDEGLINGSTEKKLGWKTRIGHELARYFITSAYLFVFFGAFTMYRRLLLAEYKIIYLHYGFALFKALVLAKVIMIGDILGLGRRLQDKPLIFTTLYKTFLFTILVGIFNALEYLVEGALHGEGLDLAKGITELWANADEVLARSLVVIFTFIPFFAFRELGRVLGERKIRDLFFRRRTTAGIDLSDNKED